jgi:hypothetical protein
VKTSADDGYRIFFLQLKRSVPFNRNILCPQDAPLYWYFLNNDFGYDFGHILSDMLNGIIVYSVNSPGHGLDPPVLYIFSDNALFWNVVNPLTRLIVDHFL